MTIGWDAVADVDWTRLFHAYGAAGDTPGHLRALTGGGAVARRNALEHLWSAVIHQGTPWAVTAPAALVVAGLLADPAADAPDGEGEAPLRAALLQFLGEVAEAGQPDIGDEELRAIAFPPDGREEAIQAAWDALLADEDGAEELMTDAADAVMARVVLDIRSAAPALLPAVEAAIGDDDPRVRVSAVDAAASLVELPGLGEHRDRVAARVEQAVRRAVHRDERAGLVLTMGRLGAAPREFLADPDPAVRACAALAPALDDDPLAAEELLTALCRPSEADAWFTDRPPQFPRHVRFTLLDVALRRVTDFERLLPAAVAIAAITNPYSAGSDWGRLLDAAFPDPSDPPAPPARLTDAQRAYLNALVANEALWNSRIGNASLAFKRVGLPHDRDACRALATPAS